MLESVQEGATETNSPIDSAGFPQSLLHREVARGCGKRTVLCKRDYTPTYRHTHPLGAVLERTIEGLRRWLWNSLLYLKHLRTKTGTLNWLPIITLPEFHWVLPREKVETGGEVTITKWLSLTGGTTFHLSHVEWVGGAPSKNSKASFSLVLPWTEIIRPVLLPREHLKR